MLENILHELSLSLLIYKYRHNKHKVSFVYTGVIYTRNTYVVAEKGKIYKKRINT